jgi:hypothetical protein
MKIRPDIKIEAMLNCEHVVGSTGFERLSGHTRAYILGYVERANPLIEIRPVFIGDRYYVYYPAPNAPAIEDRRVFPEQIDQFSEMVNVEADIADMNMLRTVPERDIKTYFADIIGEHFIQKDWGGETSDLYTSSLSIHGVPTSAAFLLKGPAHFAPMTIADLGHNADQIVRLYREPAQLLVLQHCHFIRPEPIDMMETYSFDSRRPRRFCVINGIDTVRILRAYGKI